MSVLGTIQFKGALAVLSRIIIYMDLHVCVI